MNKIQTALAVAGLVLARSGANAAIVSGATVDFTFDNNEYFNFQEVIGDTLIFSSTLSVSQFTEGSDYIWPPALSPLVTITAKSGYSLSDLKATETGLYLQKGNAAVDYLAGLTIFNPSAESSDFYIDYDLDGIGGVWSAESYGWLANATTIGAQVATALFADNAGGLGSKAAINVSFLTFEVTTDVTAVPLPGAFWLFGSALTGILVSRRRAAA